MEQHKAKREARKAARLEHDHGPLLEDSDALANTGEPVEAIVDGEDSEDAEVDNDDRPDLLLRESARIVGDMVELGGDEPALARQFSLLVKDPQTDSLN